jgi:MFS transporter, DHA1 family, multidrug resistance protein
LTAREERPSSGTLALILGALAGLGPLSIDMYLPSLPTMARDLATTASSTQLTLAAYFGGLCFGQLAYGPLADRFGRKRPLYAGLVLYVAASVGCALAPSVYALIALRVLQALGGAAGPVVMRAVIRDLYVGSEAARMMSLLTLVMGVAPILAPLLGGWVLLIGGWRMIFAVLALLGAACLALMVLALPETSIARTPSLNVATILAGMGHLARDRSFVFYTLAGACAQAGMFAYISGSPFVLIDLHHVSPQNYGYIFGANAVGLIAGTQVNRRLLAQLRPAQILSRAAAVTTLLGAILIVIATTHIGGLAAVVVSLFVFMTSLGFIVPNAVALAMEEQGARAGLASAALGSLQFAIAAGASSLVGTLNDGSMRPMAGVMAACGLAALIFALSARFRERAASHVTP